MNHPETSSAAETDSAGKHPQRRPSRGRMILVGIAVVAAIAIVPSIWGELTAQPGHAAPPHDSAEHSKPAQVGTTRVDVVHPIAGGRARTVEVPGTVHAFEFANLYARVSGFLKLQNVDIGDSVKKGQLLAELDVPDLEKDLLRYRAQLGLAEAQLKQREAAIQTAKADADVAETAVKQAEAEVGRAVAARTFRNKQYNRMKDLRGMKAIDERLVDEKQDEFEAATSAAEAAEAKVATTKSQVAANQAKVVEARADYEEAKAHVAVAQADVQKAEVLLQYARIVSPYDGVITARNFHVGDFIQSADQGGHMPVLQVQKTDVMRLVMQIPDRDVAYVDIGDQAEFKVDGLGGELRTGQVSRFSNTEDERTRSMRSEVDLKNADRKLRDGMYGQVLVRLQEANPKAFQIPSACVIRKSRRDGAQVFVCRDGQVHLVPIQVSNDDGVIAEVTQGLSVNDQVVVAPSGDLIDGARVEPVMNDGAGA